MLSPLIGLPRWFDRSLLALLVSLKIANDIIGTLLPDYGEQWREMRDRPGQRGEPFTPTAEANGKVSSRRTTRRFP